MSFGDETIICPYYVKSDQNSITCEGLEDQSSNNSFRQWFRWPKKKQKWKQGYCCSFDYEQCPISQMIEQSKYGGKS